MSRRSSRGWCRRPARTSQDACSTHSPSATATQSQRVLPMAHGKQRKAKTGETVPDSPSSLDTHTKPSSVACAARSACQVGLPDLLRPFDSGSMTKLEKWWSGCWHRKLDRLSLTPLQALRTPPSSPRRKFKWSSASVVGCRENKEENNFHPLSHALRTLQFCLCLESTRRTHRALGHCTVSRGPSTPTSFFLHCQLGPARVGYKRAV